MNIFEVIFLSVVQGITEWLPISSSGHLVIFEKWLNIRSASLEFDIFLHLASLAVLLIFFHKEIKQILRTFWADLSGQPKEDERKNWWWYIIISSVITAIIGLILYKQIDTFRNISSVASWLLVTSILLLATKFSKSKRELTWVDAIVLGVVQGLAVLPGLSRSGAVIAVALIMKIRKRQAFDYAFLLAIPAILGSFILTVKSFNFDWFYIAGFITTAFISFLALDWLKQIVRHNHLYLFCIYTLILSLIIKIF